MRSLAFVVFVVSTTIVPAIFVQMTAWKASSVSEMNGGEVNRCKVVVAGVQLRWDQCSLAGQLH